MTPEQQESFDRQLNYIRSGGDEGPDVFLVDRIAGMGSENLGPVDPPAVGVCGDYENYVTYFNSWDEVNAFVKQLTDTALEAFGADNKTLVIDTGGHVSVRSENYRLYTFPESGVQIIPTQIANIDPVTGDVSIGKEE